MSETTTAGVDATEQPADVTPVGRLAQRHGGVALVALSLFAAADAWYVSTEVVFAAWLAVLDGAVVGVVLGTLAHEWGHFAGARWSGGIAPTRSTREFLPIFDLDLLRSEPGAFHAMSLAGNLSHWAVVIVLALVLPLETPGRLALVSGAFGFAVSASATEVPIIRRFQTGASPIESFRGLTKETLRRDQWIGAAAGVALFVLL